MMDLFLMTVLTHGVRGGYECTGLACNCCCASKRPAERNCCSRQEQAACYLRWGLAEWSTQYLVGQSTYRTPPTQAKTQNAWQLPASRRTFGRASQAKYVAPKYSKAAIAGDWVLMWQDTGAVFRLHLGEDLQFESLKGLGSGQLGGRWNLWGTERCAAVAAAFALKIVPRRSVLPSYPMSETHTSVSAG